ncbi:YncE family protein [Flavobacterium aquidurense]|uniref:Lipoprotein n=1 Tax=Flavobacterium aquidurense TaxID=362413 RepID=A0A0Q0RZP5_9FLAO|nr:amine dehydrogenase large subunit [Flavobacterium aquidurense]KQB43017.1 Lipoprotein [Flavobacterium aquidurense]
MKLTRFLLIALSVSLFVSCSNDDSNDAPKGVYDNGFFILNEGSSKGGSVSFSSDDFSTVVPNVYEAANGADFAGVYLQNIFFNGDNAYIIAGGSDVINVVNRYTFKLVSKIETGLITPRYGVVKDGKAYVTNANTYSYINPATGDTDDFIAVIDLATNKVESKIDLNSTANRIILENNKLYITDSSNDKVLVVNPATKTLEAPITIGYSGDSMEVKDGVLYVLKSPYQNRGELVKIKLSDKTISKIAFPESLDGSGNLDIYGDKIYYTVNKSVYAMNTSATTPSTTPLFTASLSTDGYIYGFTVKNDKFYIGDGGDFKSSSKAYIYDLNGTFIKDLAVGIAPNGFYFNE